jgi:dynein heavy chain
MCDRHWNEITKRVGYEVKPTAGFTFTQAIDMGLMKHVDVCVEVGEKAAKEYMIETMLDTMEKMWETINF